MRHVQVTVPESFITYNTIKKCVAPTYPHTVLGDNYNEPDEVTKVLGESLKNTNIAMISFEEMLKLMSQCWQLENHYLNTTKVTANVEDTQLLNRGLLPSNPFALFSGIIPGTKWCGTGDIAMSYYDLGSEISTDRCCRAHDLCPVKIRAYSKRYNLTNDSLYTKSHCACDDVLYSCLKQADSPSANLLGNIYFNLVQVPCLNDTSSGRQFNKIRRNF
ncbi:uncharacterized protein LOC108732605 isoform X2 [Agrilus planipennis]|uniref:Phospholipase A2 n=1 Tax=Agrilus planipennis TaxID=224129 RepID=A0A1W4W4D0_AGRPL|nr:uncharacterized protein LOC108732605 isoform X2 [Agrilus planipennis]